MSRGGQAGKLGETVPRETLNGVKEGSLYDMKAKSREVAGVTPLPQSILLTQSSLPQVRKSVEHMHLLHARHLNLTFLSCQVSGYNYVMGMGSEVEVESEVQNSLSPPISGPSDLRGMVTPFSYLHLDHAW